MTRFTFTRRGRRPPAGARRCVGGLSPRPLAGRYGSGPVQHWQSLAAQTAIANRQ